ncbi:hypothetical protein F8Y89_13990 [Vibrio parahaemolyticus]|uniref:hypothetical protein n=1 Tax=Vibrio parahaemolyticus TaxID=670 RepID=UPI0005F12A00|nr:hypothetical protein [Vibrio parahaemolyticus]EGQ7679914.1 hypothetical protein [Vibrio parahaemolyticus]EGQ9184165.1 hypothetical protein [Vibrio parahaemolyticus]EGR0245000.1 hypothetical protein [Vibrio parahaemolyticus]ODA46014.1 hypothetical protein BC476_22415 [Vibrio parahaemolyticus]ODX63467.1 hypothetical protein BBM09_09445 [Vibrio parahaemolyticus]
MVTSRFKQKARPDNTSNETKDQRLGKFFHPNDKNEATRSNVKSFQNNFASFALQRDKIDYLTSSKHKPTAMLRNKPIADLANNRYVFIGTEYYF